MLTPKKNLVIMAGGASSRMKRSLASVSLDPDVAKTALEVHKALILLGEKKQPLLYHLLNHAQQAGYQNIYLIVGANDQHFSAWIAALPTTSPIKKLHYFLAEQKIPDGFSKPLGTADALYQAMEQFPELKKETFTVCNGDNLYDVSSLKLLLEKRSAPHAVIGYDREGLQFDQERIAKFALMQVDAQNFLLDIIEKPALPLLAQFKDALGVLRVSMNIFSFSGQAIFQALKNCPMHPERQEKELPTAVKNTIEQNPKSVCVYPIKVHLPDLTSAEDLKAFNF